MRITRFILSVTKLQNIVYGYTKDYIQEVIYYISKFVLVSYLYTQLFYKLILVKQGISM